MSQEIRIGISIETDGSGLGQAERSLDGLLEKAQEIKTEFNAIGQETSGLFQGESIGQSWAEGLGQSLEDLRGDFSQAWSSGWDQDFEGLGDGLSQAVSQGLQDGLAQAGPAWEQAWQELCQVPQEKLGQMFSGLEGGWGDSLGGLDLDGEGWLDGLGEGSEEGGGLPGLGGLLGGLLGKGGGLGSLLGGGKGLNLGGLAKGLAGKLLGGGSGGGGLGSLLGLGGGGGLFSGLLGGGAEGGGFLSNIFGGASEGGGFLSGIFGGGSEGGGFLGGLFGQAGGALSVAAPIGAALGVTSLGANLLGMPGPVEAIMGAFGGGGGHTQQSALSTIKADMEYLERATKGVEEAFDSAQISVEGFATNILPSMGQTVEQMGLLAERAGLGNQGLEKMVKNLDPLSAKLVEASQVLADAGQAIDAMAVSADLEGQAMSGSTSQTGAFRDMVENLAGSMHLPTDQAAVLHQSIATLMERFATGNLTVEALTTALKNSFSTALVGTAREAKTTWEQMKALEEAIRSIPTEWTSHVRVEYETVGDKPKYHQGGRVMHDGGWLESLPRFHAGAQVTSLAHDEVPIIARRGEYIVRAESVNAATLPLLTALNQTGQPAAGPAQPPPQVNLHLEVHGNLLGGEENLEELARLMERKLRDLDQARYGA
ncbi:MAG: hypothetical protein HY794_11165 [Desulfarculus sp.]|nr:hypothetical protein [Desulfarculus sp.]